MAQTNSNQAGKGSTPRNCFSKIFKQNAGELFGEFCYRCRVKLKEKVCPKCKDRYLDAGQELNLPQKTKRVLEGDCLNFNRFRVG